VSISIDNLGLTIFDRQPKVVDMADTTPVPAPIRLDDLIGAICTVHDDDLERLTSAIVAADHLGDVADHLIGHFVDQARRAGHSWTEIGQAMGVTKQAARKRFVPKGPDDTADFGSNADFSRFTDRARNAVFAAHEEARGAGNDTVTPTHLTLGLLTQPEGLAAMAFVSLGADLDRLRDDLRAALPAAVSDPPSLVPYDDAARKALELTFREALRLGHNYVGTEHIALALLEADDGPAALADAGIDKDGVDRFVAEALKLITSTPPAQPGGAGGAGGGAQ
jgi:hypothetical protein